MRDIAVRCAGLTKSFGHVRAVDSLDLTVWQGEIMALLGPSGCGKTTTLRLIAGFEVPDAGRIEIGRRLVAAPGVSLPPEQRRVGMVFQDYALFPHLTVGENVAYGLKRGEKQLTRVQEMLDLVGLGGLEQRMPHELSGGQQQRVALARAMAPQPEVLLLDEPFSNLDAGRRVRMRQEVRGILKASHATAVFVTHDQGEALFMGDRLAVLNQGRLQQIGSPEDIFHRPVTCFVAEFMGQTDFLQGEVIAEGILTEIGLVSQSVDLPIGAQVELALRADDVALAPDANSPAQVVARLFQGITNVYSVRLPSGRVVHSLQPHAVVYDPGTAVRVWVEPAHPLAYFARNGATP